MTQTKSIVPLNLYFKDVRIYCYMLKILSYNITNYYSHILFFLFPFQNSHKHLNQQTDSTAGNANRNNNSKLFSDISFLHAFLASLSVIVVSELGDKTFFIAAIMAMRHPRLVVFAGAISALALMTALSGM